MGYYITKKAPIQIARTNYFGIFPKFGGTINFWFCSTIGSTWQLQQPATAITAKTAKQIDNIFFIVFSFYNIMPQVKSWGNMFFYIGNLTAAAI